MNLALPHQINALLPQTQCTKCGFNGCLPYATAIASGEADINRCSPGGDSTIEALAELLHKKPLPLAHDVIPTPIPLLALIDEEQCIGCALCLKACPVDAILGARQLMHTVIQDMCTGCDLCVPVCPVDCISMEKRPDNMPQPTAVDNKNRYEKHQIHYAEKEQKPALVMDKQAMIKAALERKKQK